MTDSRCTRYLIVELDLPDGSDGTPDPEKATDRIVEAIESTLEVDRSLLSATVEQVYPGDVVALDAVEALAEDSGDDTVSRLAAALVEQTNHRARLVDEVTRLQQRIPADDPDFHLSTFDVRATLRHVDFLVEDARKALDDEAEGPLKAALRELLRTANNLNRFAQEM